jgi:hypothetical protein
MGTGRLPLLTPFNQIVHTVALVVFRTLGGRCAETKQKENEATHNAKKATHADAYNRSAPEQTTLLQQRRPRLMDHDRRDRRLTLSMAMSSATMQLEQEHLKTQKRKNADITTRIPDGGR